jgi:hypothetical protein
MRTGYPVIVVVVAAIAEKEVKATVLFPDGIPGVDDIG